MWKLNQLVWMVRIWRDRTAQDFIEYAMIAGFVALVACSVMPDISILVTRVYAQLSIMMMDPSVGSSAQGS